MRYINGVPVNTDTPAMHRRNFYIPEALYKGLVEKAKASGMPMAEHVRAALAAYLEADK